MANLPLPDGLESYDLECVMLDTANLPVMSSRGGPVPDALHGDLFFGSAPNLSYAQGAVGEDSAHVTLLFGIHPSPIYRRNVDAVLRGWSPEPVLLSGVSTFPVSGVDQEYVVIKADVAPTPNLLEARARLEILDHTDSHPTYHPHLTLAYVKRTADVDAWVTLLDSVYRGKTLAPLGINYGDED